MCLAEQLLFSGGGGSLGRDPCGGAMRRTEAALSPGVPAGQAVVLDMLILWKAAYDWMAETFLVWPSMWNFLNFF